MSYFKFSYGWDEKQRMYEKKIKTATLPIRDTKLATTIGPLVFQFVCRVKNVLLIIST
jgi:hypothetical protein